MGQGSGAASRPGGSPERRRVRTLTDAGLIEAMREGDPWAWGEFVARFQPPLEVFARRVGIPPEERGECVEEVLTDEALRFSERGGRLPENLSAYLMRAVRHKYLRTRRSRIRRARHYGDATDEVAPGSPESVVRSVCSAYSLRLVREPEPDCDGGAPPVAAVIGRLAAALESVLTPEEEQLLCWHGEQVEHREIAAWLGVSYDAATKRIWRLCRKARALAADVVASFSPAEQAALARVFRRAEPPETGVRTGTDRSPGHD